LDSRFREDDGIGLIILNLKRILIGLATSYLLACSPSVFAAEITYFYDGDTVKIKDQAYEYKLRITDIDAPERNQAYGKKSRRALMDFCAEANIYVAISGYDKYGRKLGKLLCNQQDVSIHMVKYGHAWFNNRFSMDYSLALLEDEARKYKLGLWNAEQQTPPWVWRKKHPH
jgi:endonuclease YncB( thermonuclease family)